MLARLPDSPKDIKGLSLFLVPKWIPDAAGNPGTRNAISAGSLEHKMGIKGNATAVMNLDGAQGWLLGEVNKGMACMFTMMNAARLGIGMHGLGLGEIACQNAVAYAQERVQMRALSGTKHAELPADPLIATTFPEINALAAEKKWKRLKGFLKKITTFSFAYNLAIGMGLFFWGRWIILIYSGEKYLDAYPALIALAVGLVFNYTLFWNRPLLLALGLPEFPIYATLAAGVIKLALSFWLVPIYGVVAAGGLLSFYYIASVGAMVIRGLQQIEFYENSTHH